MKPEKVQNEYSVNAPSFIRFLFVNWKLWLVFSIIIIGYSYIGKKLYDENYFGETIVEVYEKDVTVKATRSTPNTSVLIINPLDEYQMRLYEVDLGLNCQLKTDVIGKTFPMKVELHKRNYNDSYYLKFPNIKNFICKSKEKINEEKDNKAVEQISNFLEEIVNNAEENRSNAEENSSKVEENLSE